MIQLDYLFQWVKKDGLNVNKLLKLINEQTKVPGRKIKDVKIMANFSFITVPLDEAELIMTKLNKKIKEKMINLW